MEEKPREKAEDVQVSFKGDETHRMNETCGKGKGKGKGNGGKGELGGKGDKGGNGFQQNVKMLKSEVEKEADQEDQVAPNMGAGGSYAQAMLDPEEEAGEGNNGTRRLRWADCDDNEEEVGRQEKSRGKVV